MTLFLFFFEPQPRLVRRRVRVPELQGGPPPWRVPQPGFLQTGGAIGTG